MRMVKTSRLSAAALTGVLALSSLGVPAMQAAAQTQVHKTRKNLAHRHPNIMAVAAGVTAYKVAKTTGKNRAKSGSRKNLAQRHPILTGVAAAVVTRKVIKHSERK